MGRALFALAVVLLCNMLLYGQGPKKGEWPLIWADEIDDWHVEMFCDDETNRDLMQGTKVSAGGAGRIVFDSKGNAYSPRGTFIQVITNKCQAGVIAGTPGLVGSTDGPPWKATFGDACDLVVASDNTFYVIDRVNLTLRKLEKQKDGHWHTRTIAGVPGKQGHRDGKGSEVLFTSPFDGIALGSDGIVYVMDGNWLRKVENDVVTTLNAGTGRKDGPLSEAGFSRAMGSGGCLTADGEGNLYVADRMNMAVRKVDLKKKVVSTFAGKLPGAEYNMPRDGEALYARFHGGGGPCRILCNSKYDFLMVIAADEGGNIRLIKDGYVKSFGPPPLEGERSLVGPWRTALGGSPCGTDDEGNVYIAGHGYIRVLKKKAVKK